MGFGTQRPLQHHPTANLIAEHVPGRYALHDLLRAYASELGTAVDAGTERHHAIRRLLDHYRYAADTANLLYERTMPSVWFPNSRPAIDTQGTGLTAERLANFAQGAAWLHTEHKVLIASASQAAESGFWEHAAAFPFAMHQYMLSSGRGEDWAALNQIALRSAIEMDDDTWRASSHHMAGMAAFHFGEYDAAISHFFAVKAIGDATGFSIIEQGALRNIATGLLMTGRFPEALGHAQHALAVCRERGDHGGEANLLAIVGITHACMGEHAIAIECCQDALSMATERGHPVDIALALDCLGKAQLKAGEPAAALESFQRAISLWQEGSHRHGLAGSMIGLGDAHDATADHPAAEAAWREGLEILADMHHSDANRVRARLGLTAPTPADSCLAPHGG